MREGFFSVRMKHDLYIHCRQALERSWEERGNCGRMYFPCPNASSDPNKACYGGLLSPPPAATSKLPRTQAVPEGQIYHVFDLCRNLARVDHDCLLDNGAIKPDLVGFDNQDEPLWIIEVVDTSKPSSRVSEFARRNDIPMFVVMVTAMSVNDEIIWTSNLRNGFLPRADISSAGTKCSVEDWPQGTQLRPDVENGDSPVLCIVCRTPLNNFFHEEGHMAFEHGLVGAFAVVSNKRGKTQFWSDSSWFLAAPGLSGKDNPPLRFHGLIKRAPNENVACRKDVKNLGPCLAEATHQGYCLMHFPPNFP